MPFKLNISENGKTWKMETESEVLVGKSVGEVFDGKEIKPELEGYQLEITGGSDGSGFPLKKDIEGVGLRRVLLTKGWGMRDSTPGIRRKKTVHGKTITGKVSQINLKIIKAGSKPIGEVFPDQNKPKEAKPENTGSEAKAAEAK